MYHVDMKATQRAHILIPQELVGEIDAMVGPRKRTAFLVETARAEIRRRKLLRFLESEEPAWRHEKHPELTRGTGEWVRGLRREGQARAERLQSHGRGEQTPSKKA